MSSKISFDTRGLYFDETKPFWVPDAIAGVSELIELKIKMWGLDRSDIWFEQGTNATRILVDSSEDPNKWWAFPEANPQSPSGDLWALGYFLFFEKYKKLIPKKSLKNQADIDLLIGPDDEIIKGLLRVDPSERVVPDVPKKNDGCTIV